MMTHLTIWCMNRKANILLAVAGQFVAAHMAFAGVDVDLSSNVKIGKVIVSGHVSASRVQELGGSKFCAKAESARSAPVPDKFSEIDRNLAYGFCRAFAMAAAAEPVANNRQRLSGRLEELSKIESWPSELWPRHKIGEPIHLARDVSSFNVSSVAFQARYHVLARGRFVRDAGDEQLLLWRDSSGIGSTFSTCQLVVADTPTGVLEPIESIWVGRCS